MRLRVLELPFTGERTPFILLIDRAADGGPSMAEVEALRAAAGAEGVVVFHQAVDLPSVDQEAGAETIAHLVAVGFDPESVTAAVAASDWSLLQHKPGVA